MAAGGGWEGGGAEAGACGVGAAAAAAADDDDNDNDDDDDDAATACFSVSRVGLEADAGRAGRLWRMKRCSCGTRVTRSNSYHKLH